jgi:hypothetical protein
MMRCYDAVMRTTLNVDDDVLETARAIARAERRGIGSVLSSLARLGLRPSRPRIEDEDGIPVFRVRDEAGAITDEMVKSALEES